MGLLRGHLKILALEQKNVPCFSGDVLTLGRQAVYATFKEVQSIYRGVGLPICPLPEREDIRNKIPVWKSTRYDRYTNAEVVLKMLGAKNVYACDINNYENPDFIFDLNIKVPVEFYNRFDVVFDCGTLEHVFDIGEGLRNICRMLKVGGTVVLINPASGAIDHGFYQISPTLFYDFFTENGFSNFSCYLKMGNGFNYFKKGKVYKYKNVGLECPVWTSQGVEVCFFAKKMKVLDDSQYKVPIQSIYKKFFWDKSSYSEKLFTGNRWKKFLQTMEFLTDSFRPLWIDRIVKSKKRMRHLEYLGRF